MKGWAEPYTIAYEKVEVITNIFPPSRNQYWHCCIRLCRTDRQVTGETPQTVLKIFSDVIDPFLKHSDPLRLALVTEKLAPILSEHPSAVAIVDMALHDPLGKASGMPIYTLLGGFRTRMKTCLTIGIMPLAEWLPGPLNGSKTDSDH